MNPLTQNVKVKMNINVTLKKIVNGLFRLNMLPGFGFRKTSATHTQHWANK